MATPRQLELISSDFRAALPALRAPHRDLEHDCPVRVPVGSEAAHLLGHESSQWKITPGRQSAACEADVPVHEQADPMFTTSMSWDKPSKRHGLGLNHGFLDDTVLISFGVADYGSAYIVCSWVSSDTGRCYRLAFLFTGRSRARHSHRPQPLFWRPGYITLAELRIDIT